MRATGYCHLYSIARGGFTFAQVAAAIHEAPTIEALDLATLVDDVALTLDLPALRPATDSFTPRASRLRLNVRLRADWPKTTPGRERRCARSALSSGASYVLGYSAWLTRRISARNDMIVKEFGVGGLSTTPRFVGAKIETGQ